MPLLDELVDLNLDVTNLRKAQLASIRVAYYVNTCFGKAGFIIPSKDAKPLVLKNDEDRKHILSDDTRTLINDFKISS